LFFLCLTVYLVNGNPGNKIKQQPETPINDKSHAIKIVGPMTATVVAWDREILTVTAEPSAWRIRKIVPEGGGSEGGLRLCIRRGCRGYSPRWRSGGEPPRNWSILCNGKSVSLEYKNVKISE